MPIARGRLCPHGALHPTHSEMPLESASDKDLLRQVNLHLKRHRSSTRFVTASVVQGIVVLSGRVVSFHHRQLCIAAAQQVAGIVRVDDQLDVVAPLQPEKAKRPVRIKSDRKLVKK
jgi:hypothetical protein